MHKPRHSHSKNFVRPKLVHYYAVNRVTTAVNDAPVLYANAKTQAKLHRYVSALIPPSDESKYVVDTQIRPFLDLIQNTPTNVA